MKSWVATYKLSRATETLQMAPDVIIAIISIETLSIPFTNGPNVQGTGICGTQQKHAVTE